VPRPSNGVLSLRQDITTTDSPYEDSGRAIIPAKAKYIARSREWRIRSTCTRCNAFQRDREPPATRNTNRLQNSTSLVSITAAPRIKACIEPRTPTRSNFPPHNRSLGAGEGGGGGRGAGAGGSGGEGGVGDWKNLAKHSQNWIFLGVNLRFPGAAACSPNRPASPQTRT